MMNSYLVQVFDSASNNYVTLCECPAETIDMVFKAMVKSQPEDTYRAIRKRSLTDYAVYIPGVKYDIGLAYEADAGK